MVHPPLLPNQPERAWPLPQNIAILDRGSVPCSLSLGRFPHPTTPPTPAEEKKKKKKKNDGDALASAGPEHAPRRGRPPTRDLQVRSAAWIGVGEWEDSIDLAGELNTNGTILG